MSFRAFICQGCFVIVHRQTDKQTNKQASKLNGRFLCAWRLVRFAAVNKTSNLSMGWQNVNSLIQAALFLFAAIRKQTCVTFLFNDATCACCLPGFVATNKQTNKQTKWKHKVHMRQCGLNFVCWIVSELLCSPQCWKKQAALFFAQGACYYSRWVML